MPVEVAAGEHRQLTIDRQHDRVDVRAGVGIGVHRDRQLVDVGQDGYADGQVSTERDDGYEIDEAAAEHVERNRWSWHVGDDDVDEPW